MTGKYLNLSNLQFVRTKILYDNDLNFFLAIYYEIKYARLMIQNIYTYNLPY